MLFAATFAIMDCGYQPRCAQEEEDGGDVRVEKIKRIIRDCMYGLHDVSETGLCGNGLPRFNMPFELGLFLGAREFGQRNQKSKVALIVDREKYRYQAFLSDIAGQDIRSHGGNADTLITIIRNWLSTANNSSIIPGAAVIRERYAEFTAQLPELCHGLQLESEELLFNEFTQLTASWLRQVDALRTGNLRPGVIEAS